MQVFYHPLMDSPRVVLVHDGSPRLAIGEHVELDAEDGTLDLWILEVRPLPGVTEYIATHDQSEVEVPDLDALFNQGDMAENPADALDL